MVRFVSSLPSFSYTIQFSAYERKHLAIKRMDVLVIRCYVIAAEYIYNVTLFLLIIYTFNNKIVRLFADLILSKYKLLI
ncbi:hypothetical protein ccbrp13_59550 [Ktedonobacteria bacterium brp13]|nr:hypothetical protein ccbrp13_59550 [Ktedonobacteria bacterium brp13]